MFYQFFCQERHKQLTIQPRLGTIVAMFWEMTELSNGFEPLENKFHLPSDSIPFENINVVKKILETL